MTPEDFDNCVDLQRAALAERSSDTAPMTEVFLEPLSDARSHVSRVADLVIEARWSGDGRSSGGFSAFDYADSVIDDNASGPAGTSLQKLALGRMGYAEATTRPSYWSTDRSEFSQVLWCTKCSRSKRTDQFSHSITRCDDHF